MPQDVATTLWACASLGFRHDGLPPVLAGALARALPSCSDAEVSSALESLGRLGVAHGPLLDAVAEAVLAEQAVGAEPLHLARTLWAYGRLGRRGERDLALVAVLAPAFASRLPIVPANTLAMACRGLLCFGYANEVRWEARAQQRGRLRARL